MRHVIFDAGPWPRHGILLRWIINFLTIIIPKANPDFDEAYAQAVRWWLEIDANGSTNREIAFDADGRVVAIGPFGNNVGMFTDIEGCPEGTYGHVDANAFDAAWDSVALGRE